MTEIVSNYRITPSTITLLPARHFDYDTTVLEEGRELYVRKSPLQLIKRACLEAGSSYDGRRQYIMYQTSFRHKVPIPIYPDQQIYTFPTHSPNDFNCQWIFYPHIDSLISNRTASKKIHPSIIRFRNGDELPLKESFYLLERQIQRTAICMLRYQSAIQNQFPSKNDRNERTIHNELYSRD
ncbi:competence protein ComK [Salinibacillus kushneri]|uniref:Competence protein ComK n=1 Tax=Salinibacillus kushneri TaxID=237682 RepID=A0A1H9ZFC4_9BACI|nr:competence protein ComK [Salinibacillus kushneri]SES79746.1 competence protein ComK [Salinibacillus kushneri]